MRTINNGGTAFPAIKIVAGDNYNPPKQYHMPGMTLRDYFAAKAMSGFISGHLSKYGHEDHWPYNAIASQSYEIADAMLKARKQGENHD